MAKRYITISDLTGQPISDDSNIVTLAVLEHPTLDHPVQLDASADEVSSLAGSGKDFVLLEVLSDGGDKRQRMVLDLAEFEALIRSGDPQDVLGNAERYGAQPGRAAQQESKRRGRPRGSGSAAPKADKVDYKTLEHAGTPHRGRTTEEEANIVRNNLDTVNRRRVEQGYPPIDPQDPKDAARYGFDAQKPEDRPQLSPEFKS